MEPNIHYCVHKSPTLFPIWGQMDPVHKFPLYACKLTIKIHKETTNSRTFLTQLVINKLLGKKKPKMVICTHFMRRSHSFLN